MRGTLTVSAPTAPPTDNTLLIVAGVVVVVVIVGAGAAMAMRRREPKPPPNPQNQSRRRPRRIASSRRSSGRLSGHPAGPAVSSAWEGRFAPGVWATGGLRR